MMNNHRTRLAKEYFKRCYPGQELHNVNEAGITFGDPGSCSSKVVGWDEVAQEFLVLLEAHEQGLVEKGT